MEINPLPLGKVERPVKACEMQLGRGGQPGWCVPVVPQGIGSLALPAAGPVGDLSHRRSPGAHRRRARATCHRREQPGFFIVEVNVPGRGVGAARRPPETSHSAGRPAHDDCGPEPVDTSPREVSLVERQSGLQERTPISALKLQQPGGIVVGDPGATTIATHGLEIGVPRVRRYLLVRRRCEIGLGDHPGPEAVR